jgi:hypothetical protein
MTAGGGEVGRRTIDARLIDLGAELLRVRAERDRLLEQADEVRQSTACILAACGGTVEVPDRIVMTAPAKPTIHVERNLGEPVVRFCLEPGEWP